MSPLRENIAANFVGSIWQALMSLAFVPLYIKFMGIEAYGLIGIFATLQAMFVLLDMGLSSTLNREMARLSVLSGREQEMRNLVRSLEIIYWVVALLIGALILKLAPLIAYHWVKPGHLTPQSIEQAFRIMGFAMALQWPASLYTGGIMGLQRQVLLNVVNVVMSTLRGGWAILVLWLISPTVQAFFFWQIVVSGLTTFVLAIALWRMLPVSQGYPNFQRELFAGVWKFAAGMSGISALALILTQLDKVILSKMLSLEMFGYYSFASMVAMSLTRIFTPVFYSLYPRFTQLVAAGDMEGLKLLYHKSCQFMAVLILPIASIIALFSYQIIFLWTQNLLTAENTYLIASILVCGTAINGLMGMPYALQLAFGWTGLSVYKNLIAACLLAPLIFFMTKYYGVLGAAGTWVILHLSLFLFEIPIMHRRLLTTEKWRWYLQDVALPMLGCCLIAGLGRVFAPTTMSHYFLVQYIIIVAALTFAATAVFAPLTRSWIFGKWAQFNLRLLAIR